MRLSAHFERSEFACGCGCGRDTADAELIEVLEWLRAELGSKPVIITSGHRCLEHNRAVGGAPGSQHLHGRAADIVVRGVPAARVQKVLQDRFPAWLGIGSYARFTHVDTRTHGKPARWTG